MQLLLRLLVVVHAQAGLPEPSWLAQVAQDDVRASRFELHLSPMGWEAAEAEDRRAAAGDES